MQYPCSVCFVLYGLWHIFLVHIFHYCILFRYHSPAFINFLLNSIFTSFFPSCSCWRQFELLMFSSSLSCLFYHHYNDYFHFLHYLPLYVHAFSVTIDVLLSIWTKAIQNRKYSISMESIYCSFSIWLTFKYVSHVFGSLILFEMYIYGIDIVVLCPFFSFSIVCRCGSIESIGSQKESLMMVGKNIIIESNNNNKTIVYESTWVVIYEVSYMYIFTWHDFTPLHIHYVSYICAIYDKTVMRFNIF